ncbi:MAG: hypothetical protein HY000_39330, partial [Planctomycetes bacterium]|nr:hypothetical protein [Planctomycetota bacterium]
MAKRKTTQVSRNGTPRAAAGVSDLNKLVGVFLETKKLQTELIELQRQQVGYLENEKQELWQEIARLRGTRYTERNVAVMRLHHEKRRRPGQIGKLLKPRLTAGAVRIILGRHKKNWESCPICRECVISR